MSPILTRPVREQLEHDRVIRQLQARYKRKYDVIINPGNEQNQSVPVGELVVFPDALLLEQGGRRLLGTVEVETGESVNPIEARAEWGVYSKLRVPLHLYVPPASVDAVRRICDEYQIAFAELWSYSTNFDQVRFTLVHRAPDAPMAKVMVKPMPKPVAPPPPPPEPEPPKSLRELKELREQRELREYKPWPQKAQKPGPQKAQNPGPQAAQKPGPQNAQKATAQAKPAEPEKPLKALKPAATVKPVKAAMPAKAAKPAKPAKPAKAAKPAPKPKAKAKPAPKKVAKAKPKPKVKPKPGKKRR